MSNTSTINVNYNGRLRQILHVFTSNTLNSDNV